MAGSFDEAQAATDAQKVAALAALASGGSGALADHQAAQDRIAAMKAAAAQEALRAATQIGARDVGAQLAAQGHLAGLAGADPGAGTAGIYDRYSQDQARAGAARQAALADMTKANETYFNQVNAARPIVEGQAKAAFDAKEAARVLAEQRAAQAEADRQAAAQARAEDRQFKLEDRQAKLQAQAAKAAKGPTYAQQISELGGVANAKALVTQATDNQIKSTAGPQSASGTVSAHNIDRSYQDVALEKTRAAGITGSRAEGFASGLTAAANTAAMKADAAAKKDLTKTAEYWRATDAVKGMVPTGMTKEAFLTALSQTPWLTARPDIMALVVRDYAPLFPSAASVAARANTTGPR